MMLLTRDERVKFADYCRQQARNFALMADQMAVSETVSGALKVTMETRERSKAAAYAFVAVELESVEEMTISDDEVGEA